MKSGQIFFDLTWPSSQKVAEVFGKSPYFREIQVGEIIARESLTSPQVGEILLLLIWPDETQPNLFRAYFRRHDFRIPVTQLHIERVRRLPNHFPYEGVITL